MERSERVQQLYGYAVCLIAVVVALISVNAIVNQAFLLSDPIAGAGRYGWGDVSLTSFESFRATRARSRQTIVPPGTTSPSAQPDAPSEAELRAEYETLRADAVGRASFEARRELTQSVVMLLLAVALFSWHWRWVRGAEARAAAARVAAREASAGG